jgi:LETM1-like protein
MAAAVLETRVWQINGLGFAAAQTKRLLAALSSADAKAVVFDDDVISLWLRHACLFLLSESHPAESNAMSMFAELAQAHGVHAAVAARLEERARTFFAAHQSEFDWLLNAKRFEAAHPPLAVRMTTALSENVDALVEAMRDSGDLATLLAKRARGDRLNAAETARMKQQLVDVVKAVPALAIFALPGGVLLLPLLLKLLPFDLRPTAFRRRSEFHAFAHDATDTLAAESTDPARPSFWRRQR